MDCKHCKHQNSEEFIHPIIDRNVNKDYIYVDIVEGKLHVECELEYNGMLDSVNINYCPMCGREIKEG